MTNLLPFPIRSNGHAIAQLLSELQAKEEQRARNAPGDDWLDIKTQARRLATDIYFWAEADDPAEASKYEQQSKFRLSLIMEMAARIE